MDCCSGEVRELSGEVVLQLLLSEVRVSAGGDAKSGRSTGSEQEMRRGEGKCLDRKSESIARSHDTSTSVFISKA